MIVEFLGLLGENKIVLGVCSLLSIIGFILTLIVTFKTSKIAKILKYNKVTDVYNKERKSYQRTFEGHRQSIIEDGIKTDKILKDILKNVEAYRISYSDILSFKERVSLGKFIKILKKPSDAVDFNEVCNYLATLSGRLSKKEDMKNG